jgi:hypothetical protein
MNDNQMTTEQVKEWRQALDNETQSGCTARR